MGWPLSQDYNEAVQNPRTALADPDLKGGEAVPGPLGLPMPRSGNFADVYQFRGADGRMWALKCFTRAAAKLRERYLAVDAHLRDARLPFTVGFQFLTEGVRVRGLWYPALKMEWVEGLHLNEFVRRSLDRPDHLRAVLGLWVRLCGRLRDARIAHADLQHGNVLLVPGATAQRLKLRLIDYDGMWVPALAGKPSDEAGHPNYQHPARLAERTYTAEVDRFPHLVIGCALRALAVAGRPLWERFDNGDNLLFKEADFAEPSRSRLVRELWDLDDPTVTNLVALLVVSAGRAVADTPWLDEVISGDQAVPVSDAALAWAADRIGVPRWVARRPEPVADLYSVPEEANAFAEFGGEEWVPRPARRRRSKLPLVLAGGAAVVAAAVVAFVLYVRGNRPVDPGPSVVGPKGGSVDNAPLGTTGTRWVNYPSAPRARQADRLGDGIDVAPPGTKVVRSYGVGPAAALGAWLRPDVACAVLVGPTGIGELDLPTGRVTSKPFPKGVEPVRAAVTPNGRHAIVAGKDHIVRCLDTATGAEEWARPFPGPVGALAVTPDGERVAATGAKVGYVEWGVTDGSEVRRHEQLQAALLAFSPDGLFAVAANAGGVEFWSLDDGTVRATGLGFAATAVGFTPDSERALAAAPGRDVRTWALGVSDHPGEERPALLRQGATALTATGNGTLLFGGPSGEVGYIGPDGSNVVFDFGPDAGPVVSIAAFADGRHALVASGRAGVLLTRVADLVRPDGPSKDGPTVGSLDYVRSTPIGPDVTRFAADAAGKRIITANATHLRIHAANTLVPGRPLQVPGGGIAAVGAGPDDRVLVCQAEGDVFRTRAYDPGRGNAGPVFTLPGGGGEPGRITRFVPVPNRTWVLATTEVAGDMLFDPATGAVVPDWPDGRPGDPAVAAPSPDGRRIAVGTSINPVRVWDVGTQQLGQPLDGSHEVAALAFTPDGSKLIGLWSHGRVRVWDLGTRTVTEVRHEYPGPFTELSALTNELVVLGSPAGRLVLHLESGEAVNTGDGPNPLTARGLVVPAREWVLATDRENRLTAWRVNPARARQLTPKPKR